MRVICYHRYIEDWSKKKSFDIIPGMVHTNKRLENLNNIKEYWDNTFNMNFLITDMKFKKFILKVLKSWNVSS